MKSAAKCGNKCELRDVANHGNLERK